MGRRQWMRDKYDPPSFEFEPGLGDDEALARAMAEVRPLKNGRQRVRRQGLNGSAGRNGAVRDPIRPLREFMSAPGIDWSSVPDYIEDWRSVRNPLLLERLRRGDYSVQAQLDLHGCNRQEARRNLEGFIQDCVRQGISCVRIIHGNGKHSPQRTAVLKECLQNWFEQKKLGRFVAAYSSARPIDGGLGAIYVLLSGRDSS